MKNIVNKLIAFALSKSPENPKKKTDKSLVELFGIIAALSIIFLIWFNYPSFINWMDKPSYKIQIPLLPSAMVPTSLNPNDFSNIGERFGTYGDAYGSLNTLFSGFAFAILIISLFMQRQELKEQRKELAAQREEISKSNDIAEAQRKITEQQSSLINQQLLDSKVQAFYQLFFKYLEEKENKLESMSLSVQSHVVGNRIFKRFIITFEREMKSAFQTNDDLINADLTTLYNCIEQNIQLALSTINDQFNTSQYFEYICFILEFIDKHSKMGLDIADNAIKTLIAYQSIHEMYCMLLIGLEDEQLYNFIEKYSLLRKINTYNDDFLKALVFRIYTDKAYTV
ncbi:hypothetical protein [Acinetobacter venetianus]|nr:hypothetical protein [Acinetobacter venetianus]